MGAGQLDKETNTCIGTIVAETKGDAVAKLRATIRLAVNNLMERR